MTLRSLLVIPLSASEHPKLVSDRFPKLTGAAGESVDPQSLPFLSDGLEIDRSSAASVTT